MIINANGYWEGTDVNDNHVFDASLCNALKDFFKKQNAHSVVDIGCGLGKYVTKIKTVTKCDGFDGNPSTPTLTNNQCDVLDASKPIDFDSKYDWVLSLEVGEHLPKKYEHIFIDNLCNNCETGVVMSWAIKGQGGDGHFNEQDNDYIIQEFHKRGFRIDMDASNHFRRRSHLSWFKNTIMVFYKNN